MNDEKKDKVYRIAMRLEEIDEIIPLLSTNLRLANLKAKLEVCVVKANAGVLKPSYVNTKPRSTLLQDITLTELPTLRLRAYEKYTATPEACNDNEIHLARTYMWEHGLLSSEEEDLFMKNLLDHKD